MGFGANKSSNQSLSFMNKDSFISDAQLPYLQNLWGMASGAVNPAGAQAAGQGVADTALPGLGSAFQNIAGITDAQGQIDAQANSLQSGLGRLFSNTINPEIDSQAVASGGFGGRSAVMRGEAAGQLADAFTQGYGDIVAGARANALQASGMLPALAQGMNTTAMAPFMNAMQPLAMLGGILGGPTVLDRVRQGSMGVGKSSGASFSMDL